MKHTQGNWIYSKYSSDIGVYSEQGNGNDIALIRDYNTEEAEANAKLIAAAPELLEALKNIIKNNPTELSFNEWYNRIENAEAAIKKATE